MSLLYKGSDADPAMQHSLTFVRTGWRAARRLQARGERSKPSSVPWSSVTLSIPSRQPHTAAIAATLGDYVSRAGFIRPTRRPSRCTGHPSSAACRRHRLGSSVRCRARVGEARIDSSVGAGRQVRGAGPRRHSVAASLPELLPPASPRHAAVAAWAQTVSARMKAPKSDLPAGLIVAPFAVV